MNRRGDDLNIDTQIKNRLASEPVGLETPTYADPNGRLYRHEGRILRTISREREAFYRRFLNEGVLSRWETQAHLIPTLEVEAMAGMDATLCLEHRRLDRVTYAPEWCFGMLKSAALATLDLALALCEEKAMLQDAHPWNIVFEGTRPYFVDFTSITPADERLIWPALGQFEAAFLRPLLIASWGLGQVARSLSLRPQGGIEAETFWALAPWSYRAQHPGALLRRRLERWLASHAGGYRKASSWIENHAPTVTPELRRKFLRSLHDQVEKIKAPRNRDVWSDYYRQLPAEAHPEVKQAGVRSLLEKLQPATLTDVGCNEGVFSLLAARMGMAVFSLDSSEVCIEALFQKARHESLPLQPVIADILAPTPAHGYLSREFPGLLRRAKSDVVLCLGLMHHLHITGHQPFARIARLLAALCEKAAIVEYIDCEDDNALRLALRPPKYSLEQFLAGMKSVFREVEILPSDRPSRRLLLCHR